MEAVRKREEMSTLKESVHRLHLAHKILSRAGSLGCDRTARGLTIESGILVRPASLISVL